MTFVYSTFKGACILLSMFFVQVCFVSCFERNYQSLIIIGINVSIVFPSIKLSVSRFQFQNSLFAVALRLVLPAVAATAYVATAVAAYLAAVVIAAWYVF